MLYINKHPPPPNYRSSYVPEQSRRLSRRRVKNRSREGRIEVRCRNALSPTRTREHTCKGNYVNTGINTRNLSPGHKSGT